MDEIDMLRSLGELIPSPDRETVERLRARLHAHIVRRITEERMQLTVASYGDCHRRQRLPEGDNQR
jgi:hypothetical protein